MIRSAHLPVLGTSLVLIAVLTACGTSNTATTTTTTSTTTAMTSGMTPSGITSGGGMPMPAPPARPHNPADITFASLMIAHHQSAIQMADLASTRAADLKVKELAVQIKTAQAPEIAQMASWLAAWAPGTDMNGMPNPAATSAPASGMAGMNHGGGTSTATMPGMMTDAQMAQLTAATGPAFDKLFLQLMIGHHQGALEMARTEKSSGQNPAALALADSITTSQTAQIATMQKLLASS